MLYLECGEHMDTWLHEAERASLLRAFETIQCVGGGR